jgi:Uma2 family endonuclease
VALLIEVSESSLPRDRGKKLSAFARSRIPVYWIINLAERRIEVYIDPRPEGYGLCTPYREGQAIPLIIDGVEFGPIAVDQLLPPRRPAQP